MNAGRVRQARGGAFRLEEHCARHLGAPALERRSEHTVGDAPGSQVRSHGEPVRPGTDDRDWRQRRQDHGTNRSYSNAPGRLTAEYLANSRD